MNNTENFVTVNEIPYYKINNAESLSPFFIQVASSCDIWLFMSSNGGVTAGRKNANNNIFPYETDDKLHSNTDTGSKTIVKVNGIFWQPFETNGAQKFDITRNIYKGYYGDSIMMEEINHDLGLKFSYKYESSELYGIVRTSHFANLNEGPRTIEVLDGVSNILPYGVNEILQSTKSTLVDSYKASELCSDRLGVYSLTTQINDTPNPIEVLKANIAYTTLNEANVYLNPRSVKAFYEGSLANVNPECYGSKSAYFVHFTKELGTSNHSELTYSIILDTGYNHARLVEIESFIASSISTHDFSCIYADINNGTENLKNIVGNADGLQETGDQVACAAHYLNTLYNVMRGGTFENGYAFTYNDFYQFVSIRSQTALKNTDLLEQLKSCTTIHALKNIAKKDATMYRLALEYMPLSFSRRHGDPSRPWNKFNIALKDDYGNKISSYEGNWRDIFQNWEALGLSFPCYYENMIAKFVNASTLDGFNPYRINTQGIDWEKPEEDNPFGGYGYWGDHQIIYLYRLLNGMIEHFPAQLDEFLSLDIFTYANIPYILKPYKELLKDSKDTILFDFEKDAAIDALCATHGSDGRLIYKNGEIYHVNLTEKLLVPLLSKMSNLLIGGGIWMNTQRPEWNDANNAIVGIGLSMVTVYHIKAYLEFLKKLLKDKTISYSISEEVVHWMNAITSTLTQYSNNYVGNEKVILDAMGIAFSNYREVLYTNNFSDKTKLTATDIVSNIDIFIQAIDYTISTNKSKVYSTYNLLTEDFNSIPMRAMLEGQSAVIGSGCLSTDEICNLLTAMEDELFDPELKCHTLYPVKKTTRFMEKNTLNSNLPVIDGITYKDRNNTLHFADTLVTEIDLIKAIELASQQETTVSDTDKTALLAEYERVFAHKQFTGRSQVMYKFEGIGCVYWHQNAKLALAILEGVAAARDQDNHAEELYTTYKELMKGFIYRKTPEECNAIPIEPYSHTSFNKTSEQPGMTGQVKESVLMRRLELGVRVLDGCIHFDPWFLSPDEYDANGEINFTIYGIPTKYQTDKKKNFTSKTPELTVTVTMQNGSTKEFKNSIIDAKTSLEIFMRTGMIRSITI